MMTAATAPPTPAAADALGPGSSATKTGPAPGVKPEDVKPFNERDSRGRYGKGNPGGPGNPHARRTAAPRHAILDVVTEDEIRTLARRLLEQAKEGDVPAARQVLSYAVGKPAEAVNPDTLEVQEWELFRQEAGTDQQAGEVIQSVPVPLLCEMARATMPIRHFFIRKEAVNALLAEPAQPEK